MEKYIPTEFPKWVDGKLVHNAAEERGLRTIAADAAAAAGVAERVCSPSLAGIRMRRTRERPREGKLSIRCDISTVQIEALAVAVYIDPALRDDAAEVARGVCRSLERLI